MCSQGEREWGSPVPLLVDGGLLGLLLAGGGGGGG